MPHGINWFPPPAYRRLPCYRPPLADDEDATAGGSAFVRYRVLTLPSVRGGIDPKVVADQLGHGLGVNLDVYTKSDLQQRAEAVKKLEAEVIAA